MDLREYQSTPILGDVLFAEPAGGRYAWGFFLVTVLFSVLMWLDRGPKVAALAGGGLILLAIPNVLPESRYDAAVVLRIVAIVYYVALWIGILLLFPDAPTFFAGNW